MRPIIHFFSYLILAPVAFAQSMPQFKVTQDCDIYRNIGGYLSIKTHIGSLPFDAHGHVRLRVHNPYPDDIEFGTFYGGCACLKTTLSSTLLKKNDFIDIDFALTTPRQANSAAQVATVIIAQSKDFEANSVTVTMEYTISGLVAFKDSMVIASVLPGTKLLTFRVPVVVAEPAQWKNVECSATGALRELALKMVPQDAAPFIECSMDTSKIGESGLTGELIITDKKSGIRSAVLCCLELKPVLTIAPSPLRLRWEEAEKCYRASAIVQLNATKSATDGEGAQQSSHLAKSTDITINATIKDARTSIEIKELVPGSFRVYLAFYPIGSAQDFRDQHTHDDVILAVSANGKDFVKKCGLHFLR